MQAGQLLPGMVYSPELGTILGEYLATCAAAQSHGAGIDERPSKIVSVLEPDQHPNAQAVAAVQDDKLDRGLTARRGPITGKMLRENFHLPLHTVAKKFGMCTTAFKKLCRRFEIPKWPHRQVMHVRCPYRSAVL
jgi:hypothetical protein